MSKSVKDALASAKLLRDRRAAQAAKPAAPERKTRSAASIAAERRANKAEAELEKLRARQDAAEAARATDQRASIVAERMAYARKAGIKVGGDVLARLLPDVDPRTADGVRELEKFRTDNPDLYTRQAARPADVSKEVTDRISAPRTGQRQPIADRKIFGVDRVNAIVARNLGGES